MGKLNVLKFVETNWVKKKKDSPWFNKKGILILIVGTNSLV